MAAEVSWDKLGEDWVSDSIGLLANETSVMVRDGVSDSVETELVDMDAAPSIGRSSSGGDVGDGGSPSCACSIQGISPYYKKQNLISALLLTKLDST